MDQVREIAQNITSLASDALASLEEQSGLPPLILFTVIALLFGAYFLISGILAPSQIGAAPPATTSKSVDPPLPPQQLGEVSASDLARYDGKDARKPLLMAIKGKIYDVSSARGFYGPGGPYESFAGKDASRALAKMSFDDKDFSGDLSGLSEQQLNVLEEWEIKFGRKYTIVGAVVIPESAKEEQIDDDQKPEQSSSESKSEEQQTATPEAKEQSQEKAAADEGTVTSKDRQGVESEDMNQSITTAAI